MKTILTERMNLSQSYPLPQAGVGADRRKKTGPKAG